MCVTQLLVVPANGVEGRLLRNYLGSGTGSGTRMLNNHKTGLRSAPAVAQSNYREWRADARGQQRKISGTVNSEDRWLSKYRACFEAVRKWVDFSLSDLPLDVGRDERGLAGWRTTYCRVAPAIWEVKLCSISAALTNSMTPMNCETINDTNCDSTQRYETFGSGRRHRIWGEVRRSSNWELAAPVQNLSRHSQYSPFRSTDR
jgi:hypothetical protein